MVKDYYRLVYSVNALEPHIQKLSDEQVFLNCAILFSRYSYPLLIHFIYLMEFSSLLLVVEIEDRGVSPAVEAGCNSS